MARLKLSRRFFLLAPPLAMAACGFTPVYGPQGTGNELYGQIEVQAPDTPQTYLLVRSLEERLGRSSGSPRYKMDVALTTIAEGQAITASDEITRYSLVGVATYKLTRLSDEKIVNQGEAQNFTGYSAEGSTVDALASERDAIERLMMILADQITAQVLATSDLSSGQTASQVVDPEA
ncbi:MAG: hypothetical protein GJ676_18265 [Rhodobacteraceae bacterium]|nr:hypothetical protein [Paracoccaceae bacterium]